MGLETFLKLSSGFGEPCGSPTEPPPLAPLRRALLALVLAQRGEKFEVGLEYPSMI